jgi:hypothetical protein
LKQIWYQTNDAGEIISARIPLVNGHFGVPIVIRGTYGQKGGSLDAFAIREDFSDLCLYPVVALNIMRKITASYLGIYFTRLSKVSLFLYGNRYFILRNLIDRRIDVGLVLMEWFHTKAGQKGSRLGRTYSRLRRESWPPIAF